MKSVFGGPVRGHVQVELLSAYLDQQASPAERAYVDAHLQQCMECRAELDSLRRTVLVLQALPRVPVPRAFTLSEAQVGIRRPAGSPAWLGGLVRGLSAVAAIALVAFVALSVLRPGQAPWSPSAQTAPALPTPAPMAKLMATEPATTAPAARAQSQPEAPVAATGAQETAAIEPTPTAEPAPALAAAPAEQPTATAADTVVGSAAASAAAPTQASPTSTGSAPLVAKAAPSPAPGGEMGTAAAPEAGAAAMGRGGGGPSEPAGIPPEFLTPEPTPEGQPLAKALPGGVRVAYADLKGLWAIDRDGGARQLVQGEGINMPQLSPDQQWIVYRTYGETGLKLWAIRWEGGEPKLLLDDATVTQDNLPEGYARRAISDTRWAPKGPILAVTMSVVPDANSTKLPVTELWQLNVETGEFKPAGELGSAWRPYYSPDGKSYLVLEYGTEVNPEGNLRLVEVKSGKSKTLMTFPASPGKNGYDGQVVWAPDGKAAYVAIPTGDYGTPTPPNGTKLYRVSDGDVKAIGEVDAVHVFWAPTTAGMVYMRYLDASLAKGEMYLANADGSQAQLYATTADPGFVGWSPKGTRFLYQDNYQIFVGSAGQPPKKLANATSMVYARWISENSILALHDTINGWLLTLRGVNGEASGLLPLPREAMWDVQAR